jgi:hypothetical protein
LLTGNKKSFLSAAKMPKGEAAAIFFSGILEISFFLAVLQSAMV